MKFLRSSFLGLGLGVLLTTRAFAVLYNPTTDFSIDKGNPNGVWSYGWMPTDFSVFNLDTLGANRWHGPAWSPSTSPEPVIWKNTTSDAQWGVPVGWLALHPGSAAQPSVLRWTAPDSGLAHIAGEFLAGDGGNMQVAVRLNNTGWWSASDAGSFDLTTGVVRGSTIDFAVFGGYYCGNTPLAFTIEVTPVPELSTWGAGGLALLALVGPMIRRKR